MKNLLVLFLLLSIVACASSRLDQMEDRIASLEEKVDAAPPVPFNPHGCILWPGWLPTRWQIDLDSDMILNPSAWPIGEHVPAE